MRILKLALILAALAYVACFVAQAVSTAGSVSVAAAHSFAPIGK